MANLMDIYYKVGKSLYEKEFDFKTIEEKKVLVEVEHKILPLAVKLYCEGKVKVENGRVVL